MQFFLTLKNSVPFFRYPSLTTVGRSNSSIAVLTLLLSFFCCSHLLSLDAVSRAKNLHQQYASTADSTQRFNLRNQIRNVIDELSSLASSKSIDAIGLFYDFSEFDATVTSALADIDSKDSRLEIARGLRRSPGLGGSSRFGLESKSSRRGTILSYARDLSKSIPSTTIVAILSDETHKSGISAILEYMSYRFSPRYVSALLDALEESSGSKGFNTLDKREIGNRVRDFFKNGLHAREPGSYKAKTAKGKINNESDDSKPKRSTESPLGPLKETLKKQIHEKLLTAAKDKNLKMVTRHCALRGLGVAQVKEALPVIQSVLEDEDSFPFMITGAVKAAVDLGDPEAGKWIYPLIKKMSKSVNSKRVQEEDFLVLLDAIYPLKITQAKDFIIKSLRSKNPYIKLMAIRSLPVLGEEETAKKLASLFKSKSWRLRQAAIQCCQSMRSKLAVDLLIEQINELDGRLRYDLLMALHEITGIQIAYVYDDWKNWWSGVRESWTPPPKTKEAKALNETEVLFPKSGDASYFGMKVLSKRLCFIGDISGSMGASTDFEQEGDQRIEVMKDQMVSMIKTFKGKTYFNIYFFDTGYRKLFKHLTIFTRSKYKATSKFINSAQPIGATNIYDPLEEALKDKYVDTIYLLSDGYPTAGKVQDPKEILRSIREMNHLRSIQINTISIGHDSDFLKKLAEQNSGRYRYVK